MIDRDSPVTEHELHAYVDGEIPADRRDAVEAWLGSHPEHVWIRSNRTPDLVNEW